MAAHGVQWDTWKVAAAMQAQEQHYQQQLDRLTSKYKVLLESADGEYKRFDNGIAQQQEGAAQWKTANATFFC